MPIQSVSKFDTGVGGTFVKMVVGPDGSLVVVSSEGGTYFTRLEEDGTETVLAANPSYSDLRYGGVETLSDGRYAVHTSYFGAPRVQILNANGTPATELINPVFEGQDPGGAGYTVAATLNGGFAVVWNDNSRSSDSFAGTCPPYNGNPNFNSNADTDVRIRYFDANGAPTTASTVADDDIETVNGTTISRRALSQNIHDSEMLTGGQTAFVYLDSRWVGNPSGGANGDWQLSLQIAAPGNVGEPIKIDLQPLNNNNVGEYPQALHPATASANVVALRDGTFAVIWTEQTYVPADVYGGWGRSGTQTLIRYFDAAGTALTDAVPIVTRGLDHGNHTNYVWGQALADGSIAIAYNIGVDGVSGNGRLDAFVGVVGPLGASLEVQQVNPTATNGQFYGIQDFAARADGTVELVYSDATQANNMMIGRFAFTGPGESARVGTGVGDTITGDDAANAMFGLAGDDRLFGSVGEDRLHGQDGNDLLVGGAGADRLFGGVGNDTYRIEDALDTIVERAGQGSDTVAAALSYTLAAGVSVETLGTTNASGTGAINLTGNELNNSIYGNEGVNWLTGGAGNDTLNGLGGADTLNGGTGTDNLRGGTGNDTYVINDADVIYEAAGQGEDRVVATVSYVLTAGASVEALATNNAAGTGAINLTGNELNNSIYGNEGANSLIGSGGNDSLNGQGGNDTLNGGIGTDNLRGGTGNDLYVVNDAADFIFESTGQGDDRVSASVSYVLTAGASVETMGTSNASGTTAIDLTGNELNNTIFGNAGVNLLAGAAGNDSLSGGAGDDVLKGGVGNDVLRGQTGLDSFQFDTALGLGNIDQVIDFSVADDTILLENSVFTGLAAGALAPGAFRTGSAAADADDRVLYNSASGALLFDSDGAGGAAAVHFATLSTGLALSASDFTVI
jgi:Ca2+-binding RTX toxin-like protein